MKRWVVGIVGAIVALVSCGATAVEVNPDWGLAVLGVCGVIIAGVLKFVPAKNGLSGNLVTQLERIYDKIEALADRVVTKEMCNDRHQHYTDKADQLNSQLQATETELASLKDMIIEMLAGK